MNKRNIVAVLVALCCCVLLVSAVLAQASAHYRLSWNVLGAGGGSSQSPHYTLNGTAGQLATGISASTDNRVGSGFWYAYGSPAQPQVSCRIYLPLIMNAYP